MSRFADAGGGRALGFLAGFGLITAVLLAWVLQTNWWPVIDLAVREFPEQGPSLNRGRFDWPEATPRLLADSPHLGVAVRPGDSEALGRTADLQLELLPRSLRLVGIAGFVDLPWPPTVELPLGRLEARAAWEAWRRPILAALVVVTAGSVTLVWSLWCLALALPLRLAALMLRRQVTLGGCWRLGAAACMGASMAVNLGLVGYGMRWLPWPALAAVAAAHLLLWILYLWWGLLNRPGKSRSGSTPNPFREKTSQPGSRKRGSNPFG